METEVPVALPGAWRTAARAAVFGALAGVRVFVPLRQLAKQHRRAKGLGGPWPLLSRRTTRWLIGGAALVELVGDKLPGMPSRLAAPELAGRFASGAIGGAAVFAAARRSPWVGAAIGGASAYAGAVIAYRLRVGSSERERARPLRGIVEDSIALRTASRAARELPIAGAF